MVAAPMLRVLSILRCGSASGSRPQHWLTDELVTEGIARDTIRAIQARGRRPERFGDRINLNIAAGGETLAASLRQRALVTGETLAVSLS